MGIWNGMVKEALDAAFACLVPSRCRLCRAPLFGYDNAFLCAHCAGAMPWIGPGACGTCGYPPGEYAAHGKECRRCRGGWMRLTGAVSVARYRLGAKVLVKAAKFAGEAAALSALAGMMAARYRRAAFYGKPDLVVPVSLHARRRRERGFDQSSLLARKVAAECGMALGADCLERIRWTPPQAALGRRARLTNLEGAFRAAPSVSDRRILLIDDVMTTGATMAECARALRAAGAKSVYGLTFAR